MDKEKFRLESINDVLDHVLYCAEFLKDNPECYESDNIHYIDLKFWVNRIKALFDGDIDEEYAAYLEGEEA